jgi:predicted Fe-S protein YdhL (DUF1289 family)
MAPARPPTPCINICTLDENQVCLGCRRTLDEIAEWSGLSPQEQWRIVGELPARAGADELWYQGG